MQTAHNASCIPLFMGQVLQRFISLGYTRIEKDIQINTADDDYPVIEPAKCTQLIKGVPFSAKNLIEPIFNIFEACS